MQAFRKWIYELIVPTLSRKDNPEYNRRLITLVDAIWAGILSVFIILPLFFLYAGFIQGLIISAASILLLLTISLTIKLTGNLIWTAHVMGVCVFLCFGSVAFFSGGIDSPIIFCLMMLIPINFDIAGRKVGMGWALTYMIIILLAYILQSYYSLPNFFPQQDEYHFTIAAFFSIYFYIVLFNRQWQIGWEEINAKVETQRQQLLQQDKMATLGQLTAGIAHEVNNPLNFISTNTNALQLDFQEISPLIQALTSLQQQKHYPPEINQLIEKVNTTEVSYLLEEMNGLTAGIANGSARIQHIVSGLKSFSYQAVEKFETHDLTELVDTAILMLTAKLKKKSIHVHNQLGQELFINCVSGKLIQVFINLIDNAIAAMDHNGILHIEAVREEKHISVRFSDNGIGMDEKTKARIFEPFFTTKEIGQGTGLGLSISYGIIQEHGGEIHVESKLGEGTSFRIDFLSNSI